ncbi:hypothetical protein D3C85_1347820 [compost metagenome]
MQQVVGIAGDLVAGDHLRQLQYHRFEIIRRLVAVGGETDLDEGHDFQAQQTPVEVGLVVLDHAFFFQTPAPAPAGGEAQ